MYSCTGPCGAYGSCHAKSNHEYVSLSAWKWIMQLGIFISVAWTVQLIHSHAEPHVWYEKQERWVLALCFFAYLVAWVPVWLLPFDMMGLTRDDRGRRCNEKNGDSWLQLVWLDGEGELGRRHPAHPEPRP